MTQEISLEDHEPYQLKMMLQYLYMDKYIPEPAVLAEIYGKEDGDICLIEHPAAFHAQMYGVGDYFQIPGLKTAAQRYFTSAFPYLWNDEAFCTAVSEVYSSTPESDRGLRDIVVQTVINNHRHESVLKLNRDMLKQVPEFSYDFGVAVLKYL